MIFMCIYFIDGFVFMSWYDMGLVVRYCNVCSVFLSFVVIFEFIIDFDSDGVFFYLKGYLIYYD